MKLIYSYIAIIVLISFSGCKVNYSFTGASIPEDVKTVSVKTFQNYAPLANPNYAQNFTEALKDIFLAQTSLALVAANGDLQFEGEITDYKITSVAIQGNETAALNRLSITVKVRFTNTKDKLQDFESSFTRFSDYSSSQSLTSVEEDLLKDINSQLTQDIFNRSVSNW
ncbi:MAG: LptE family protein [Flavobacteriales bacterium]|nr:LptE family protein [Flavobacteriales bacterium]